MINYQNIKLLNKNGIEIPLLFTSNIIITDANSLSEISDDNLVLYGVTTKNNNTIELTDLYLKSSSKFKEAKIDDTFNLIIDDKVFINAIKITCDNINDFNVLFVLSNSNNKIEKYYHINKTDNIIFEIDETIKNNLLYPSLIFYGKLDLGKISTGLIETETIISGFINDNKFTLIDDNDYKITYNIDKDSHFKFFSYNEITDEVIWDQLDNNIVNIGFNADIEGVYEHKLFINITNKITNESIVIGQIDLICEAIGEDERYRALFNNFGLQEPYTYSNIFKDTDINEANPDWEYLNKKSKELFLSYNKIFPYVGTYKALINAVKYLGYDDIYFREWYKIINDNEDIEEGIIINLDNIISSKLNNNELFNNKKKLNKLSMHYKMTTESGDYDKYHIPIIKEVYQYSIDEVIIKLFALKKWLEKNIIGVNCKIIDITGEGIVYEKINYFAYGMIMQNIVYDDIVEINPSLKNTSERLIDGSANINITSFGDSKENMTSFEDFQNIKFNDRELKNGTIQYPYVKNFSAKVINDTANAIIDNVFLTNNSRNIWLNNGELYLMHKDEKLDSSVYINNDHDLLLLDDNTVFTTINIRENISAIFKKPPIIQLKNARILSDNNINEIYAEIYTGILNNNSLFTEINYGDKIKTSSDYIYLYPNNNASFSYTQDNALYVPLFKFENYKIVTYNNTNNGIEKDEEDIIGSFYLNITDGKIILDKIISIDNNKQSILSFYYDNDSNEQQIKLINEYSKSFNYKPHKTYLYSINDSSIYAFNYDRYHKIKVNNTGDYNIIVYASNSNGNILGKTISEKCNVYQNPPKINIRTYNEKSISSEYSIADNYDNSINNNILYNNSFPFFRENLLISNLSYNDHEYVQHNNITYATDTGKINDTLNLFNISDIFEFIEITNKNIKLKCLNVKNRISKNDIIKIIIYDKIYNTSIDEFYGSVLDVSYNNNICEIIINNCSDDCINAINKTQQNYEQLISVINASEYYVDIHNNTKNNKTSSVIRIKDDNEGTKFNIGNNIKLIYNIIKYPEADKWLKNGEEIINKNDVSLSKLHYDKYLDAYIEINPVTSETISYKKLYVLNDASAHHFSNMATFKIIDISNGDYILNNKFKIKDYLSYGYIKYDAGAKLGYAKIKNELENYVNAKIKTTETIPYDDSYYITSPSLYELKVAPAHQAFVKYTIPIIGGKEFKGGYNRIFTSFNKLYDYIDNTFSCNITHFNNINAFEMWNNDISTFDTSLYIHNAPVILEKNDMSYKNNIIVDVTSVDSNDVSTYWDVYKVNTLNGTRELLFEVLNDKMYLTPSENSLYDIVAHSYDKYGNLISVEHPGIIKTN